MSVAIRRAAVLAGVAALILVAGAQARPSASGLHNTRYCEVLELRGAIPDAEVTVWNTVGLSDCPPEQWEALDPTALAAERGAGLVVLNGPRYFMMDSASGRVGATSTFGALEMRKVATIAIDSADDLVQTPYAERTIERHNTWSWDAGRRVYELLAPDGARYVMQSYSRIRDPSLKAADLRSLGDRLALPEGWRYRVRRLRHDLDLRAHGSATIIQDELLDTYQRVN